MTYIKFKTPYAKKWHVQSTHYGVPRTLCGYPVVYGDQIKSVLRKHDPLCLTCMLVRAHSKQKLNRK